MQNKQKITKTNVSFTADGVTLRGWFYSPTAAEFPVPCIIMTHGFSALKEHGLDPCARVFAEAGMAVLVYDQRNFGDSEGEPRLEVDPLAQVADLRQAIHFVQAMPRVNPAKIGLWGTSFSAGNVLVLAAQDQRVSCLVAQVPFLSGQHKLLQASKTEVWEKISRMYAADQLAQSQGKKPVMIPVVATAPMQLAAIKQADAYEFFTSVISWRNEVTLRSLANAGDYEPLASVANIKAATLFIIASNDTVTGTNLAVLAFDRAAQPKKLLWIDGDHFAPFAQQYAISAAAARDWFSQYLLGR